MDLDGSALRAVTDLTLALDRECRLIEELRRAVLQQREAVERGDVAGVESSIRLASRSLLTLQENQRHRSTLLRRLVGDPAQPLAELDERFESALPAAFLAARGEDARVGIRGGGGGLAQSGSAAGGAAGAGRDAAGAADRDAA